MSFQYNYLLSINPKQRINSYNGFFKLMGHQKATSLNNSEIIRASEIGQYHYCPVAWYLQKCGYKPNSPNLEVGKKKHEELGNTIDHVNANIRRYRGLAILGYLSLIAGVLIFLFEVVL